MDLNFFFFFAGTNIQTNEEVAIKLVSGGVVPIQLRSFDFFIYFWLILMPIC